MNYRDYFSRLDKKSLMDLADRYGIPYKNIVIWRSEGDQGVTEALTGKFLEDEFLENVISELSSLEQDVLKIIFCSSNRISTDNVLRKLLSMYGKGVANRALLDGLAKKGVLIMEEVTYNRIVCSLPQELHKFVLGSILCNSGAVEEKHMDRREAGKHSFTGLLGNILVYLSHIYNNEVRVTQKGRIFKKSVDRLLELMKMDRADPAGDEYPPGFDFIEKLCRILGFTDYEDEIILVDEERVLRWLALDLNKKLRIIRNVIDKILLCQYEYREEIFQKLKLLFEMVSGKSLHYTKFINLVGRYCSNNHGHYYINSYTTMIDFLGMLGLLDFCRDEEGAVYITVNLFGQSFLDQETILPKVEEEDHFYIQPTYEILAPININALLRWELEKIAYPVKVDNMLAYTITKHSIENALEKGKSMDDIVHFLKEYSKAGIPQNVEYSVKEWSAAYGGMYIMDVAVLRCRNGDMAQEIINLGYIAESIIEPISEKDFIIRRAEAKNIIDYLRKKGYMPLTEIIDPEKRSTESKNKSSKVKMTDDLFNVVGAPNKNYAQLENILKIVSISAE